MNLQDIFGPKDGGNSPKSNPNSPCSIPAVQKVLSVTKDAGVVLAGVGRDVNSTLQKLGGKNVSKGTGFAGLFPKPGIVNRAKSYFGQAMFKMLLTHGLIPAVRSPLESGITTIASMTDVKVQSMVGSAAKSGLETAKITALDLISSGSSPTESTGKKVTSDSLRNNPAPQNKEQKEREDKLLSKYEETIAKLTKLTNENEKLFKKLLEAKQDENNMKICPHNDCLECRRRQRKAQQQRAS